MADAGRGPASRPAARTPNLPGRSRGLDAAARARLGGAYAAGAEHYDAVRPGYPDAAVDFMLPPGARDAADVGAGTGILTAAVAARGLAVTAVDPSADMLAALRRRLPGVPAVRATAEDTGLPAGAFDVVLCAQAWHWVDPRAASGEAARILRPGGWLALVWNQLDVTVPWVHRLARIMHAGDVHRPEFAPVLGPGFGAPEPLRLRWGHPATPEAILDLARSRSYYLRAGEETRRRVETNLRCYLHENLGHAPGAAVELPYATHAWRAALRPGP